MLGPTIETGCGEYNVETLVHSTRLEPDILVERGRSEVALRWIGSGNVGSRIGDYRRWKNVRYCQIQWKGAPAWMQTDGTCKT